MRRSMGSGLRLQSRSHDSATDAVAFILSTVEALSTNGVLQSPVKLPLNSGISRFRLQTASSRYLQK
jgi:hypothetical protein